MTVKLLDHQYEFVTDVDHRYLCLRAGYGAGKTFAFCMKALHLAALNCEQIGDHTAILCEPTFPMIDDVLIPGMWDVLEATQFPMQYVSFKRAPQPQFTLHFENGSATILLRSAENYERLIGMNLAWAGVDELDTIQGGANKARAMWKKLQGRLRVPNAITQVFTTSTPEGFKFMYEFFEKTDDDAPAELAKKRTIAAKTRDNPHLPQSYIDDLMGNYTEEEQAAYLDGLFTNMTTGRVYTTFDRSVNCTDLTIGAIRHRCDKERDMFGQPMPYPTLHIGMDFNKDYMAAVVHVIEDDKIYAIDELVGTRTKPIADTPAMIELLNARYKGFPVVIYPDCAGAAGSATGASMSSIRLLQNAGYKCLYHTAHPAIADRVAAMKIAFKDGHGNHKYYVNTSTCPIYTSNLERQVYGKDDKPDKTSGMDHANDAAGYFIQYKFPVKRVSSGRLRMAGVY